MYQIIKTGSKGNAVVINDNILIDCGVSYRNLPASQLKLVLLTHEHRDHFNADTIRRLVTERPTLRFACGEFLVEKLVQAGVHCKNGYRLEISGKKIIYATDTYTLRGIKAKNYDYYLLEANYEEDEIRRKIKDKETTGQYVYEYRVLKTHLSKEECDSFLLENMGNVSEYEYLHYHKD